MALVHCRECGEMISETAPTCPKCGASQRVFNSTPTEDKPNIGLNIVSFLWPIIGLIFYIVFDKETPKRAKDCGKWALIGFIVQVLLVILIFVVVGIGTAAAVSYY